MERESGSTAENGFTKTGWYRVMGGSGRFTTEWSNVWLDITEELDDFGAMIAFEEAGVHNPAVTSAKWCGGKEINSARAKLRRALPKGYRFVTYKDGCFSAGCNLTDLVVRSAKTGILDKLIEVSIGGAKGESLDPTIINEHWDKGWDCFTGGVNVPPEVRKAIKVKAKLDEDGWEEWKGFFVDGRTFEVHSKKLGVQAFAQDDGSIDFMPVAWDEPKQGCWVVKVEGKPVYFSETAVSAVMDAAGRQEAHGEPYEAFLMDALILALAGNVVKKGSLEICQLGGDIDE